MVVYGDAHSSENAGTLVRRLAASLDKLDKAAPSLDDLRASLIRAGELEQAAADAPAGTRGGILSRLEAVTDCVAEAFEASRRGGRASPLRHASRVLRSLPELDFAVTVRVPEGFAHYALYPEQYVVAAERWAAEHRDESAEEVLVVGVRSIGTTLSAVVGAALRAEGRAVRRITVRPGGHPWERQVQLSPELVRRPGWALVVDEGPGMSGSSMAAVAEALQGAGLDGSRIVFFPGHGGEPGSAATGSVRDWWTRAPRMVVAREELRWEGHTLVEALAARLRDLSSASGSVAAIEDLAGGRWRRIACGEADRWPAVCAAWERPKYGCRTTDGRYFLWKYHGLSSAPGGPESMAQLAARQMAERAADGWTLPPLGTAFGFVLTEWAEGRRFTTDESTSAFLEHLGRYVARVAGPVLSQAESEAAWDRLGEVLRWNAWEGLGKEAATRAGAWIERLSPSAASLMRSYGDGRLSPEHWLVTPDGRWLKTAAVCHGTDHTIVGPQPILWDVAGALVEWGLEPEAAGPLLRAVPEGNGSSPEMLAFYRSAYAAFRMGQCLMSVDQWGGAPAEQNRLRREAERYRVMLVALLAAA